MRSCTNFTYTARVREMQCVSVGVAAEANPRIGQPIGRGPLDRHLDSRSRMRQIYNAHLLSNTRSRNVAFVCVVETEAESAHKEKGLPIIPQYVRGASNHVRTKD